MQLIRALVKRLLSYRKRTWTLDDYPIRCRRHEPDPDGDMGRLVLVPWHAQIIHWWLMDGSGDTPAEALENLRVCLEAHRETHETMPRPGTRVPLEFASSDRVDRYPELREDFVERILDQDARNCWISDDSSLSDFSWGDSLDPLYAKIEEVYGVDVSDVEKARLAPILERIAAHGNG